MGITVSGAGNGADMAVQLHVAFSRTISGACLRDAQPFHCATTRFPAEPLVHASHTARQLCDRRCESGRTLRFDHCRHDPASIDVGMLPDYPRRACGGDSGPADGGGRVDGCLDDPRFLGESRVYLAPGADAAVTASTAGRNLCPHPLPTARCLHPPPLPSTSACLAAFYAMMLFEPTTQLLLANGGGDGGGDREGLDLPACFAHLLGRPSTAANSTTLPAAAPTSPPAAALRKRVRRFEQARLCSPCSCTVCNQGRNHASSKRSPHGIGLTP